MDMSIIYGHYNNCTILQYNAKNYNFVRTTLIHSINDTLTHYMQCIQVSTTNTINNIKHTVQ
jgi:hypothetical protein